MKESPNKQSNSILIKGAATGGRKGSASRDVPLGGAEAVDAFKKAFNKGSGKSTKAKTTDAAKSNKSQPKTTGGRKKFRDTRIGQLFTRNKNKVNTSVDAGSADKSDLKLTPVPGITTEESRDLYNATIAYRDKLAKDGVLNNKERRIAIRRYTNKLREDLNKNKADTKAQYIKDNNLNVSGPPLKMRSPMKQDENLIRGAATNVGKRADGTYFIGGSRSGQYSKDLALGPDSVSAFTKAFNSEKERKKKVEKEIKNFDPVANKQGLNSFKDGNMQCADFSMNNKEKMFIAQNRQGRNKSFMGLGAFKSPFTQKEDTVLKPAKAKSFKQQKEEINGRMKKLASEVRNLQGEKEMWVELSGGDAEGRSYYSAGSNRHYKAALDDIMTKSADTKVKKDGSVVFQIEVEDASIFPENLRYGSNKIEASVDDINEKIYLEDSKGFLDFSRFKKDSLIKTSQGMQFDEEGVRGIVNNLLGDRINFSEPKLMSWATDDANRDGSSFMADYLEVFPNQKFLFDGSFDLQTVVETDEKVTTVGDLLRQEIVEYNVEKLRRNHNMIAQSKELNNVSRPRYTFDNVVSGEKAEVITGYES
jgi:uncharacterized protein YrzB (UPF0473 family)